MEIGTLGKEGVPTLAGTPSRYFSAPVRPGYGNRTRLLGLGSRCTTDVLTLRFWNEAIIADFSPECKAKFAGIVI